MHMHMHSATRFAETGIRRQRVAMARKFFFFPCRISVSRKITMDKSSAWVEGWGGLRYAESLFQT